MGSAPPLPFLDDTDDEDVSSELDELQAGGAARSIAPNDSALNVDEDEDAERLATNTLNDASADDLFVEFQPSHFAGSPEHETSVMEAATLATVAPPELWYQLALPQAALHSVLSRAQLEAVAYACQRHEGSLPSGERAGFLIGDGTGVGKGREIAAIIWENALRGRTRAVWFTCSGALIADAARDLADVTAGALRPLTIEELEHCLLYTSPSPRD